MAREVLSNVDAAWLHMEDPTNLMMIAGFFQFDGSLDMARLAATIEQRLLKFKRFRQRIVDPRLPMRSPYWEIDPHFDLEAHLHRIALPAPGDDTALTELVSHLASTPLDFTKPLWQFHVIEGYDQGDLLFGRLHHCIADGIALMHVLLSLCDDTREGGVTSTAVESQTKRRGTVPRLFRPAANLFNVSRKLADESFTMLTNPALALDRGQDAAAFVARLGHLVMLPPDPKTLFKGDLGVTKRTAWSQPLDLAEVKALGGSIGGTINDVLLTIATGALRRYMVGRGESPDGLNIRAMVPVNLRSLEDAVKLGNHFGLVVLSLPIGIDSPVERMVVIKQRMDELKNTPEAIVGFAILQAMGLAPTEIERLGVGFFATKASAVMTNVPGPRQKQYLAGSRIDKLMFWVPQSGRMGMGISILSYAGEVVLGVITDAGLVPDPQTIIHHFHAEFDAFRDHVASIEAQRYHGEVPISDLESRVTCKAMTLAGNPCRNRVMAGSAYCHVHAKQVADSTDVARQKA